MLGLQVQAPFHRIGEWNAGSLEAINGFGIIHAGKVGLGHPPDPLQQAVLDMLVEEGHLLGALFQGKAAQVADELLGQVGIVGQIGKGHLRFDHPEFGGMAGGIGIFGPKGRAEGVDIAEGQGEQFTFQLAADGQAGPLAEEILAEVRLALRAGAGRRHPAW